MLEVSEGKTRKFFLWCDVNSVSAVWQFPSCQNELTPALGWSYKLLFLADYGLTAFSGYQHNT